MSETPCACVLPHFHFSAVCLSGTSCPPLFLPPDLGQCRKQRHICSWRLCLLLLSPKRTPNLFPSPWQDGNISYTIHWFCISVLFSCLLIRNLDLSCAFTDRPKTFINSLVCLGRGEKGWEYFSWTLLSVYGLGPALACLHFCGIESFSKGCFVHAQAFNLHNLGCFHSCHT